MKTITIFCFTIIAITIAAPSLPSDFKVCKCSDPNVSECLTNAVKEAIIFLNKGIAIDKINRKVQTCRRFDVNNVHQIYLFNTWSHLGLESFKIMPLEPFKFVLNLNKTESNLLALKQEYRNSKIYGLTKKFELHDLQMDLNNAVMKFYFFHEQIDFLSDYKAEDRILSLPIHRDGKCKISLYDATTHHEVHFEMFEKNGETYIRVKKYFVKCSYKRVTLHYDDHFKGNQVIGKEINKFINENSLLIFQELQPFFEEAFARIFFKISNKIFSQVPLNKIFPLTYNQ